MSIMKFTRPNTDNCLVNLSCSILKKFGATHLHKTIPEVDSYLKKSNKVVLLLFDGMGKSIVDYHLKENSYLNQHKIKIIDSVFPPTTVAATDALLSGMFPIENGWLGWTSYYPEYDRILDTFSGNDSITGEKFSSIAMEHYAPYSRIYDTIKKENPIVTTDSFWPAFSPHNGSKTLSGHFAKINKALKGVNSCFYYAYWHDPDHTMHEVGIKAPIITKKINAIESKLKKLVKDNPDTIFLVVADHALVDVKYINIDRFPDFTQTLERQFSIEGRAANFFVKKGKEEEFEEYFREYFGDKFVLLTRQEVLDTNVFGEGKPHQFSLATLGDYLAISVSEYCFCYNKPNEKESDLNVAMHAGGLEEESKIYLFGFNG